MTQILEEVKHLRNIDREMRAVLVAVKPMRAPRPELQPPRVEIVPVSGWADPRSGSIISGRGNTSGTVDWFHPSRR